MFGQHTPCQRDVCGCGKLICGVRILIGRFLVLCIATLQASGISLARADPASESRAAAISTMFSWESIQQDALSIGGKGD